MTKIIEKEDILLSVKKNIELDKSNVKSFKQLIKTPRKSVIARSEKQSEYIRYLKENDVVMSLGWNWKKFSCCLSRSYNVDGKKLIEYLQDLQLRQVKNWVSYPDMKEKVDPYLRPLYDALYELFGPEKIDKKIESEKLK